MKKLNDSEDLKPVIHKDGCYVAIPMYYMIKFINENSDYEWNELNDMLNPYRSSSKSLKMFWEECEVTKIRKEDIDRDDYITEEGKEWMTKFFEAHPFLDKVMFYFDG